MNTKLTCKKYGFTLIEILVSLAICSILIIGLYLSFINIIDFTKTVETETTLINMDNMLTILFDRDITSIYMDKNNFEKFSLTGKNEMYDGGHILTFFTTNSLINKPEVYSINMVTYSLKKNIEKDYYSLFRTEAPFGHLEKIETHKVDVKVADYITNLNIFFWDKNGAKYDYWDPEDMKSIPSAISIEISFKLNSKIHKLNHLFSIGSNET